MENPETGVHSEEETESVVPEERVHLSMPTGVYYEKSDWAAGIESKEEAIQEAYSEVMDWVNLAARLEIDKYMQSHPEEHLEWSDKEKEKFFSMGSVQVIDEEVENRVQQALRLSFNFGKLRYLLTKQRDGYSASLENFEAYLIPNELKDSIRSQLQDNCRQIAERFNRI